jgi:hypothetical protein
MGFLHEPKHGRTPQLIAGRTAQTRVSIYIAARLDGFIARPDGALDWLDHDAGGEDYGWAEFRASVKGLVPGR